jgi:hypothetical protein
MELLDALRVVHKQASSGTIQFPSVGICGNAVEHVDANYRASIYEFYGELQELFLGWPEHSGDMVYPIESTRESYPWNGDRLKSRLSLLDYAIAKLERQERGE